MTITDTAFENFQVTCDERGIATITIDLPHQPHNVFNQSVIEELAQLADRLEKESDVRFVIFRSGKASGFLAGADVTRIQSIETREEAEAIIGLGQELFTRIERLPIPTLAAIHGPCLGGGLEFALACRYRIARDDSATRLGLPEIQLGLLPGWGGTQRLPRTIGLARALQLILTGSRLPAKKAERHGLIHCAAPPERFDAEIESFVADRLAGKPLLPPKRGLVAKLRDETRLGRRLVLGAVRRKIAAQGEHYPAAPAAVRAVETGLRKSFEEGLIAERKAFVDLLFTPTCRNLLELFFARERARKSKSWVDDQAAAAAREQPPIERIAVIGAGTMGAGIAQLAAYEGYAVALRDVDEDAVGAGMKRIERLMNDLVQRGSLRSEEAAARLNAVTPCVDWGPAARSDLAIEAVVERMDVKQEVFRTLDERLPGHAILASNTSALPVAQLAGATGRPAQVAGLHFFNPVHKMQLVEIVRTGNTANETVARLVDFVRGLGKTPVVVADSPGFLVNRILFPYLDEGVRMVCEGLAVDMVDREARRFGMPMGPLELLDQVGLDVATGVARTMAGKAAEAGPTPERLQQMVDQGRLGKKSGRGFYEYKKGRRGKPVVEASRSAGSRPTGRLGTSRSDSGRLSEIQQRLVGAIVNESAKCLEERIVTEAWVIDLAMVLGTGFAPFRGGPLRLADQWGIEAVVCDLRRMEEGLGARFAPCSLLQEMDEHGRRFYPPQATEHEAPSQRAIKSGVS